jgi:putative ABC transport system ATP-binding protein
MTILKMENVSKTYQSNKVGVQALSDFSMTVEPGEFLSLAGPSGSGKTTALNMIGCLDKPTTGNLYIDGVDISTQSSSDLAILRRNEIGFVFQTFNLIPILSAFENVELPLILKLKGKMNTTERKSAVEKILTVVGLKDLMNRKPAEMSGGQQQRVAIARALVKEPKLILADEPTANLDSETGKSILELMHQLNAEKGVTFIFSTHDKMVMDFAKRIVMLKDGKIQMNGKRG